MLTKESLLDVRPMSRLKAAILRSTAGVATLVSLYALYIEYRVHQDSDYDAFCDISPSISCSKVLTSEWSYLFFGVPNPVFGLLYYAGIFFFLKYIPNAMLVFFCVLSVIFSSLLIYVLAVILKDFCLVCAAIHVVNFSQIIAHIALQDPPYGKGQSGKKEN